MDELAQAIKRLRIAAGGISQETLAHRIGVTVRTVSRWEGGDKIPLEQISWLRRIANESNSYELEDLFDTAIKQQLERLRPPPDIYYAAMKALERGATPEAIREQVERAIQDSQNKNGR